MMRRPVNRKGVSPIIATILMVSVTVVLASVLYVMIIGMGSGSSDLAPLGSWLSSEMTGNSTALYTFGSFSYDVTPSDLKLILVEGTNETVMEFQGVLTNKTTVLTMTGHHKGLVTALYEDNNWQSNTIGNGDKLLLYGLEPDTVYTVKVFHIPTDQIVSMTGDSSSIQTQP